MFFYELKFEKLDKNVILSFYNKLKLNIEKKHGYNFFYKRLNFNFLIKIR